MEGGPAVMEAEMEDVYMWGWGAGTEGQIGMEIMEDQHSPQPLHISTTIAAQLHEDSNNDDEAAATTRTAPFLLPCSSGNPPRSVFVSFLACGGAHTIALTNTGKVLTWGRGTQGQLGHGHPTSCWKPRILKILENFVVSSVSAGWNHSGFVTDGGCLLTCGDGSFGQLGHGNYQSLFSPTELSFFATKYIKKIAFGTRHSLALVKGPSGASIHSFGSGRRGQLGIHLEGTSRLYSLPQIILALENEGIDDIFCNGDHSAALSIYGELYLWGRAFSGRLNYNLPLKLPTHLKFSQVALGWNHALVLTDNGELFMVGGNHHGKLCALNEVGKIQEEIANLNGDNFSSLERISSPDWEKVVHIGAGSEHSALVTESGAIMTWGWGEHGQLGLGNIYDQIIPQVVSLNQTKTSASTQFKVHCDKILPWFHYLISPRMLAPTKVNASAPEQSMHRLLSLLVLVIAAILPSLLEGGVTELSLNHYKKTCPNLQHIVQRTVTDKQITNPITAAGTLRLFFHDCFSNGCDASLLVKSTPFNKAERDSDINHSLPGDAFDVVVRVKSALEVECPGIVSCADILALTTRDLVIMIGGPYYSVQLGRKDSRTSNAANIDTFLPKPSMPMSKIISLFTSKGFTIQDMVALTGAHTVGFSHCKEFANRVFGHQEVVDPTLNPRFAVGLKKACKDYKEQPAIAVFNDVMTPNKFDNMYYQNLQRGLGLLESDAGLVSDPRTRPIVQLYAANQTAFFHDFVLAIQKFSELNVKTGKDGEVRRRCDQFN